MPPPRSPDQASAQSVPARACSPCAWLVLWLVLPLVVYVAVDGWLDPAAVRYNADLVHFHALGTAAQMTNGQIEWDEGRLCVSVPPVALVVFVAPEIPVRSQVTYQVSIEHGHLLAERPDLGTCPAFDAAGLVDVSTYIDTVEGQPAHAAVVVCIIYDVGHTGRVVTRIAQTMNGRDVTIRQLWWPAAVRQLTLVGLTPAMVLIGLMLELWPISRLADNVSACVPTDFASLDLDGLQHELQPIAGALNQYLQCIADNALTQKRFTADAAHQVCTPLAILDTQMQVAVQTNADAALHKILRVVRTSMHNLADLINNLLLLSQAGSSAAASEVVDLSQVARTALEDLALLAGGRRIDLDIELVDPLVWTPGDRMLTAALLFNLVDNAVRCTQEGGHVTVQVSVDYSWAIPTVIDNSPGISPEAYTHAFECFACLDGTQIQGTGLGLVTVRQTVDRMGGQIVLAPGSGGIGLAVTVWLRRVSAPAAG